MTCDEFRSSPFSGEPSAEFLKHLRNCAACMNYAAEQDELNLFRALGGDDLVPPGGVDLFVGDVMRQIHVSEAARIAAPRKSLTLRYVMGLAAAAALTALSFSLVQPRGTDLNIQQPEGLVAQQNLTRHAELSLPVVENYDNSSATIVEIPNDQTSGEDVKVVMIFDESLPADL